MQSAAVAATHADPKRLARPSGAYAMLAIDQRAALRKMLADAEGRPISDADVTAFKLSIVRTLSPLASAILLDTEFVWHQAVAQQAVAPSCVLIAAVDRFIASDTEFVADVEIDDAVPPARFRTDGAAALKLLVPHRPQESAEPRVAMVRRFIALCREAGLVSIVEPVARGPRDGGPFDRDAGILAAARELGSLGADLYKGEVPQNGRGDERSLRAACAAMTRTIASPWVVLSSGVEPDDFPRAVGLACAEGASGFLAGRAVWKPVIGQSDRDAALAGDSADRLRRLVDVADRAVGG